MNTGMRDQVRNRSRRRRRWAVVAVAATVAAACVPAGGPNDLATLRQVKASVYGAKAQTLATQIAAGLAQPAVGFTVENTPPSIFVNRVVPDAQAAAFESFIGLPPGFSLAKVKILESDAAAHYWLSLNVYRVSGITTGLRAEWNTYVDDGSGVPRFMIIQARAAEGSLDPIGPLAPPEPFQHSLSGDVISTAMNKTVIQNGVPVNTPDNLFNSTINLPDPVDRQFVTPTREWAGANDFIYWMNGVNDRTFYNSTAQNASMISVDLGDVALTDDSEFVPYVEAVPEHVLVYLNKIEFVVSPWWNITETDGRVSPATISTLRPIKSQIYGGLASQQALGVQTGTVDPLFFTAVEESPESVYWHWQVPPANLAAFESLADLPPGTTLAPVRLQEDDVAAAQWLTLQVSNVSGNGTGLRAEWTTTVDDGDGIRTLVLEGRATFPWLDADNVPNATTPYTQPYPITHTVGGGVVDTTIGTGPDAFASSFVVPAPGPTTTVLATRDWVGSTDLRYSNNGIADRVLYDSSDLQPKISVDPVGVSLTDGGVWTALVGTSPDRVWVDQIGRDLVVGPWWNL